MIRALNHAVLFVRDAETSVKFYVDVLDFSVRRASYPRGAFLVAPGSANDHDLALFSIGAEAGPSEAGRSTVGLYHLAWEVGTLGQLVTLRKRLLEAGALVGESDHGTSKSLYAKDVDGLEFEVLWQIPASHQTAEDREKAAVTRRLDLAAELDRFGPDLVGADTLKA